MSILSWIIIGIICAIIIILLVYPIQAYLKIRSNKKRIKKTFLQIQGQVDIKHNLLKEYIVINRDSINEQKYSFINDKINSYKFNYNNVELLKDFNEFYSYQMKSFDDALLNKQCDESEEKINHIKSYYNELVYCYNKYKSNGVNIVLSKALSIEDEKLY